MALTPRSGSLTTPSGPDDPVSDTSVAEDAGLAHLPFITNSELNKYALDTTTYLNTNKALVGFMRGKRVTVTYYRLLNREGINNRTNVADLPSQRNVLSSEYQKILNLEITLPKGFEFTANNAQANMSIKGQAMFYPNMNPHIGDMFTIGTGDGRIGVCRISSVTPMSWRTDRIYTVDFVVHEFVTDANHDPTEGAVTLTSVFSKENYLGGTAALLSEQTFLNLQKIREIRSTLCRHYHLAFFDSNVCSYMRPDGIYDPCVVKFMANKLTMDDLPIRPKNLLGQITQIYQHSLWARFEDRFNKSLYFVSPYYTLSRYNQTRTGVFVTELYGRSILLPSTETQVNPEDTVYYLYTSNFYNGTVAAMTAEELLVYNAITKRTAGDLGILISNYLDLFITLSPLDQFYKIPLYVHLIDMALLPQYREADAPSMSMIAEGH
jgi:hypothetical protein